MPPFAKLAALVLLPVLAGGACSGLSDGDGPKRPDPPSDGGTPEAPALRVAPELVQIERHENTASAIVSRTDAGEAPLRVTLHSDAPFIVLPDPPALDLDQVPQRVEFAVDREAFDADGTFDGEIHFRYEGGEATLTLRVEHGEPLPAALRVDLAEVDFGDEESERQLVLRNAGELPLAWRVESVPAWLSTDPEAGDLAAPGTQALTLSASREALVPGNHEGLMVITSDAEATPRVELPVFIGVSAPPRLTVEPQELRLAALQDTASFILKNDGEGSLDFTVEAPGLAWLALQSEPMGTVAPGESEALIVRVLQDRLNPGDHCARIEIRSNGGDGQARLCAEIADRSVLRVTPRALELGAARSVELQVENVGVGILIWSVEALPAWIGVRPTSGEISRQLEDPEPPPAETLSLSVDLAGLAPGVISGELRFVSNGGDFAVPVTAEQPFGRWSRVNSDVRPERRRNAAIAWDPLRNVAVLFGGSGQSGDLGDTWEMREGQWQEVAAGEGPGPRHGAALAWDPEAEHFLLYGGSSRDADTWTYDAGHWAPVDAGLPPLAVTFASLVHDPDRSEMLLMGGLDSGGTPSPAWSGFDGTRWQDLVVDQVPTMVSPSLRPLGDGALVATATPCTDGGFCGGLRVYLGSFTEGLRIAAPIPASEDRNGASAVVTPDAILVYGGAVGGRLSSGLLAIDAEGALAQLPAEGEPPPRGAAAMWRDPRSGEIYVFGGEDEQGFRDDTYRLVPVETP